MTSPRLRDVVRALEARYDPRWAEPWDAVGLVLGDPDAEVGRVLLAVDPVDEVVEEALAWGADLVLTHHPLFLRGVHGFAATTPKGSRAHRLVRAGAALYTAHTNADVAVGGVSDALADLVGLRDVVPLRPQAADALDKLVVFVPVGDAERVLDACADAGAGTVGDYRRCAWTTEGTGTFRPVEGARPTVGSVGQVERVREARLEVVLPRGRRDAVVAAMRRAHPYEEPAFDVLELATLTGRRGLGRVGELPSPVPLRDLARRVAAALPATPVGVRAAGDPDRVVRRVAVSGGAGDSLLGDAAACGADAFVTADLRHHPTGEALERGGPALLDVGHWASEWPWLRACARQLVDDLAADGGGTTVETRVSELVTDPWTLHTDGSAP